MISRHSLLVGYRKSHPVPTEKEKLETQIRLLKLMHVRTQAVERLILELQNDEDFLSDEVTEQASVCYDNNVVK